MSGGCIDPKGQGGQGPFSGTEAPCPTVHFLPGGKGEGHGAGGILVTKQRCVEAAPFVFEVVAPVSSQCSSRSTPQAARQRRSSIFSWMCSQPLSSRGCQSPLGSINPAHGCPGGS